MPWGKLDPIKIVGEFVGTFFLCLAVNAANFYDGTYGGLAIGTMLMLQIYCWGPISGGHLNPAVTCAVAVSGKMDNEIAHAIIYPFAQIVGGILGCILALLLGGDKLHHSNVEPGVRIDGEKYEWYHAGFVEFLYTCMLCMAVLNTACTKYTENNQYFALAIGGVIWAGAYAGGPISGGAFNPAIALGKDIASAIYSDREGTAASNKSLSFMELGVLKEEDDELFGGSFKWCSVYYILFELCGALLACGLYRLVRPEEFGADNKDQEFNGYARCLSARLLSEFLGTFFLALTAMLKIAQQPIAMGMTGLCIASALMTQVYTYGTCSGGHLNPAVTAGIAISGRKIIKVLDVFLYMIVQLLGGIIGCIVGWVLVGWGNVGDNENPFQIGLRPSKVGWARYICSDVLFTYLLVLTVLSVATTANAMKDLFGFAIGFVVLVAVNIGIWGANINPAIAMGIDIVAGAWKHEEGPGYQGIGFLYWIVETIGAGIAAGVFILVNPDEYKEEEAAEALAEDESLVTGDEEEAAAA